MDKNICYVIFLVEVVKSGIEKKIVIIEYILCYLEV